MRPRSSPLSSSMVLAWVASSRAICSVWAVKFGSMRQSPSGTQVAGVYPFLLPDTRFLTGPCRSPTDARLPPGPPAPIITVPTRRRAEIADLFRGDPMRTQPRPRRAAYRPRLDAREGRAVPSFLAPVHFDTQTSRESVVAADFTGDGNPDLAAANAGSNSVSVLLGNGDGSFQPAQHYPANTSPQAVAAGHFNGDGRPDLAVAN